VFHAAATQTLLTDGGGTLRAEACMVAAFLASEWIGMGGRDPFLEAFACCSFLPAESAQRVDVFFDKPMSTHERTILFVTSQVPCDCLSAQAGEAKKSKKGAYSKRQRICSGCGKLELVVNVKFCVRCQLSVYCSKKCQRNHWKSEHMSTKTSGPHKGSTL
jgi:hypothetical protein